MPAGVTTSAKHAVGTVTIAAARSITARTGVYPEPMISKLVMSAPSQCVKLMTSAPAMPGKKYLLPPEKPTTSCGKTGPQMTIWS